MKSFFIVFFFVLVPILHAQEVSWKKTMVIAHRGASAYAPENTLAAFRKAIELRADALELDVRQTKDSQLVVIHDASVHRTTDGEGEVREFAFSDLKKLDAGSWFDEQFRYERIPTLQEVIRLLDSSTTLIIEIKEGSGTHSGIEQQLVEQVRMNHIEKQVMFKSFHRDVLSRLRDLAPDVPLVYVYFVAIPWLNLTFDLGISIGDPFEVDAEYLQPHKMFLTKSFVQSAHEKGYKVIGWDVQSESVMKEMIIFGVDGIETDYPDVFHRFFREEQDFQ